LYDFAQVDVFCTSRALRMIEGQCI